MPDRSTTRQPTRISRRAAIQAGAVAAAAGTSMIAADRTALAFAVAHGTQSVAAQVPPAWNRGYTPRPLPYDPGSLNGLSERLIQSHWQNNYGGAVNRLNQIEEQIANLPANAPPFLYGALKREELIATNAMILHEYYFDNMGGSGNQPQAVVDAIGAAYGDYDSWERDFRATAVALGGGSGWVILSYSPRLGTLRNSWAGDHTQNLAAGVPILVLDMYEHSYHMDFGTGVPAYIEAFWNNINWEEMGRRMAAVRAGSM
jgi:superoxide dismutase, Fe-Mn family